MPLSGREEMSMTDWYDMDNNSCNTTCGCMQSPEEEEQAIRIGNILSKYVLPCIVLPGIFLNGTSCLVFTSSDLKKLSSSVYILALLVSDTGVLFGLLFVWLEAIGFRINHVDGVCQALVFFPYMFSFLSVWYVVCVTVENYITICHPCRIKSMCTRRRAASTCVCVFVASVLLYSATPFTAEVRATRDGYQAICTQKPELIQFMQVFTYIDSLLTLLVPLIAISCMLIGLVLSILHATKWKKRMGGLPLVMRAPTPPPRCKKSGSAAPPRTWTNTPSSSSPPLAQPAGTVQHGADHASTTSVTYSYRHHHGKGRIPAKIKSDGGGLQSNSYEAASTSSSSWKRTTPRPKTAQVRVTRMLFALSVSYLVMNAPSHVTRLYYLIRSANLLPGGGEGCQLTHTEGLINLSLQYVTYAHNASKFWIFILFSKNFMKGLTRLINEFQICGHPCC